MPKLRGKPKDSGRAFYTLVTGLSVDSEPADTQGQAQEAVKRAEKEGATRGEAKRGLASAVGVSVRTVERWLAGTQQAKNTARGAHADGLQQAMRAARVSASRREALSQAAEADPGAAPSPVSDLGTGDASQASRNSAAGARADLGNGLTIKGDVIKSDKIQEGRTLFLGPWIPQGSLDSLIEMMIKEGPEAVGGAINNLISTHYVSGMRIENITEIDFQ